MDFDAFYDTSDYLVPVTVKCHLQEDNFQMMDGQVTCNFTSFNGISEIVISGGWEGDYKRLYAMEPRLPLERILLPADSNLGLLDHWACP